MIGEKYMELNIIITNLILIVLLAVNILLFLVRQKSNKVDNEELQETVDKELPEGVKIIKCDFLYNKNYYTGNLYEVIKRLDEFQYKYDIYGKYATEQYGERGFCTKEKDTKQLANLLYMGDREGLQQIVWFLNSVL